MSAAHSLIDTVAAINRGEASCEAVTRTCLERIAMREPVVHAWIDFDPDHALAQARNCRNAFSPDIDAYDVLVVPSCAGEAPPGLESTGDPLFNRTWSLLHAPCVQVPLTTGPNRLPLGVQVVGRIGDDARTLAAAHWIETRLRETPAATAG